MTVIWHNDFLIQSYLPCRIILTISDDLIGDTGSLCLTYLIILNFLRVEQLRVKDLMERSFAELDTQKKRV